ncbi:DUF4184 family protein [Streptomyces sp. VRA16 Mangrove soil]|uniref:DUF4184 family protein n=1 Tax=Streptomyces sp. VRA16 Mangrove soil TaxID=2817434 RepID=UPI001A9F8E18|nr:DUF4184 family protein [Streptomyces sp. VRA16 Mangrove soil]MBO1335410.1 DUF4184 family protein [Streptomyces sp. VRA16 Mangrove soil]
MPFTISHAAAVLPFVRRDGSGRGRLVPSLLVAGSFAPDVTYFAASAIPGAMEFGTFTHSFAGVCTVDVLFAAGLVALWRLVREPVLALLPGRARGRVWSLVRGRPAPGVPWLWWYVSAVLGAVTHVVWDAFTHHGRWGVRLVPVLGQDVAGSPLYWYAQYGTSALALVVTGLFLWRSVRAAAVAEGLPAPTAGQRWLALALIGGCACGCGAVRVARWLAYVKGEGLDWAPWEVVPAVCFGAGAGLVVGVVAYAVAVRAWRGPAARTDPGVRERPAAPSRPGSR